MIPVGTQFFLQTGSGYGLNQWHIQDFLLGGGGALTSDICENGRIGSCWGGGMCWQHPLDPPMGWWKKSGSFWQERTGDPILAGKVNLNKKEFLGIRVGDWDPV